MKAVAQAHTNIALIKYWGKRDEALFLPMNSSLSITLDRFYTTTGVQFCKDLSKDIFMLNGELVNEQELAKMTRFLDIIRNYAGVQEHAIINSTNKVPTAAGFASSASGYAAVAAASTKALGLELGGKELSMLARRGSGSATRSIFGGYVEWQKGEREDGSDSYAKQILGEKEWGLTILSVLLESKCKKVSSREGMKRTVETSPFYSGWLDTVEHDIYSAKEAIRNHDFDQLGKVSEANALKMHATMLGATPPFTYWQSGTLAVMERIQELREEGISAYFTIDAGPNVKVLCMPNDEERVRAALLHMSEVEDIYSCHPGPGITYLPESTMRMDIGY
ncbi:diphosphomevalonate decarboxylase [Salinibacillus xinjiangensis]|uniref:diphosphomevalonate decarboxylase n=1 Tax=Salinibacillus xinjiangensis TaxID=1229268 RepID=A0A6G1X477_9BACI|nr:diphosphomevalonate decarboxylase [Salinibacillus xinjiangensis]MRG85706.1 diphosphomevalonate decarboxylase [Salinibacillus xinjiangensis]